MPESVYRVTEVVGVSSESWEAAARVAVETATKSVRELRIAEVIRQDEDDVRLCRLSPSRATTVHPRECQ